MIESNSKNLESFFFLEFKVSWTNYFDKTEFILVALFDLVSIRVFLLFTLLILISWLSKRSYMSKEKFS